MKTAMHTIPCRHHLCNHVCCAWEGFFFLYSSVMVSDIDWAILFAFALSSSRFVANATPAQYTENLKEISDVNTVQVHPSLFFPFLSSDSWTFLLKRGAGTRIQCYCLHLSYSSGTFERERGTKNSVRHRSRQLSCGYLFFIFSFIPFSRL